LQEQLLSELSVVLNILGKNANRIHLFVAAQSSMCINIGKCYQDNVYGSLELYSYTKDQGYNWSITYNQGAFS
ncbi:SAVED domain-containing protein, partial [Thiolapillus sp.]